MDEDSSAKRLKLSPRLGAKEWHAKLMQYYRELTLEKLSNPKHANWIPRMDRADRAVHMGRALTKRLIDFISKGRGLGLGLPELDAEERGLGLSFPELSIGEDVEERSLPELDAEERGLPELDAQERGLGLAGAEASFKFFQSDGDYGFSFITGTPGAGKTWSLRASVLYLYGKFADERAKGGTKRMNRILFLEGQDFAKRPEKVLWKALFQSYSDDDAALGLLESVLTVTFDAIEDFIRYSKERLIVVIDDGNKVKRGGDAHNLLCLLRQYCPIIFCASVSSEWIDVMRHPKAWDYELVVGGLDDVELAYFLQRFKITRTNLCETGTIPRLIQQYATNTALFENTMQQLEDGINEFLLKALQRPDAERLRGQLAGSLQVMQTLTPFLESRCFYRGQDGVLECLTPRLLHYARIRITEMLELRDLDSQCKELTLWMEPIFRDELRSRIGLNAEMAAILAMKFFTCNVYYEEDECVKLNVRRVQYFEGQMSRSILESEQDEPEGGTLFVPRSSRHAGIDVYYRDSKFLIAVQISVQRNAEAHHHKTVEKAEEIFDGEKREKILLWVIDTDDWCSYNTERRSYYYVTMPFKCLSSRLAKIDDRLKALRTSTKKDVCWECHNKASDNHWIQCDSCDLWYHRHCAAAGMKPRTSLRRTTVKSGHPVRSDQCDQPFECRGCRDHMRRPPKART